MICKERDPKEHSDRDRFSKAGAEAEEKMAFYLRRSFADSKKIRVFNDLRFKDDTDDRAQIDHLVLHPHGFVLIESKSVSTKVKVNEHAEWFRLWNNHWQGMQSPVQQAKFQTDFLRRALNAYCEDLVGKALGFIQIRFNNCPMEILVAISDRGSITRETNVSEVVKADQVPDRIKSIVDRHKKGSSIFNLDMKSNDGMYNFSNEEMERISEFLLEHHQPLEYSPAVPEPAQVEEQKTEYQPEVSVPAPSSENLGICKGCGEQCIIKWGRYSYYWKCLACDKNMGIKEYCPACRDKMKLRKQRNRYFIYCENCNTESLYWEYGNARIKQ